MASTPIITRRISQLAAGADLLPTDVIAYQRGDAPAQRQTIQGILDFLEAYGAGALAAAIAEAARDEADAARNEAVQAFANMNLLDGRKWARCGWKIARLADDYRVIEGIRGDDRAYAAGQWVTGPDAELPSIIRSANFNGQDIEYLDARKWARSGASGVIYVAEDLRIIPLVAAEETDPDPETAAPILVTASSGRIFKTNLATGVRSPVSTTALTILDRPDLVADQVIFTTAEFGASAVPLAGGEVVPVLPTGWVMWGSSSAAGANGDQGVVDGGGNSTASPIGTRRVTNDLATNLGVAIFNGGVSSQRGQHIAARADAIRALVTVTPGAIPASGAVAVTVSNMGPNSSVSIPGSLNGVAGTLASDGASWTFTRSAPGGVVAGAGPFGFVSSVGQAHRFDGALIWSGKNNINAATDVDGCISTTRALWDHVGNLDKRRLVIGHFADRDGPTGNIALRVAAVDEAYAAAYGDHHVPIQPYLCDSGPTGALARCIAAFPGQISVSASDTADFAAGRIPLSLMANNLSHLNAFGHWAVTQVIEARIRALHLTDN